MVKSSLYSCIMKQVTVGDSGSGHVDAASPHLSISRGQIASFFIAHSQLLRKYTKMERKEKKRKAISLWWLKAEVPASRRGVFTSLSAGNSSTEVPSERPAGPGHPEG